MAGVCGVLQIAGGFVDAAHVVNACDEGRRDFNDLLSCSHNPLTISIADTDAAVGVLLIVCRKWFGLIFGDGFLQPS